MSLSTGDVLSVAGLLVVVVSGLLKFAYSQGKRDQQVDELLEEHDHDQEAK